MNELKTNYARHHVVQHALKSFNIIPIQRMPHNTGFKKFLVEIFRQTKYLA